MRETYCEAEIKVVDVTALSDATPSTAYNKDIADIERLANQNTKKYMTGTNNAFVLDGEGSFLDNYGQISFISNSKSGADCNFASAPMIEIGFEKPHTSAGITLYFGDAFPSEITMEWYDGSSVLLIRKKFYPDKYCYFCDQKISDYQKLKIFFNKTMHPFENAYLQCIDYGLTMTWGASDIIKAKVLEEVNPTSSTLSINTANISIIDEEGNYDIQNDAGMWKVIQKEQEVKITEYIDGNAIPMGLFFINEKSYSGNKASFSLIDKIGVMDAHKFYAGRMYNNVRAEDILQSIFESANISEYEIADEIKDIQLTGTLVIQTCREALQMVCFVCDCIADDSRSGIIRVYRPSNSITSMIRSDRKMYGSVKMTMGDYVSGVTVTYNKYSLAEKTTEIYNDTLPSGKNRIEFSEPYEPTSISVSGGELLEASTFYAVVNMESDGVCKIEALKYEANKFMYSKNVDVISAGETENVISFGDCTLYNSDMIIRKANSLLEYHSLRKSTDFRYILNGEKSGDKVSIVSANGNFASTVILSQDIDLSGGFVCSAKCSGFSIYAEYVHAGEGMYMPENELI